MNYKGLKEEAEKLGIKAKSLYQKRWVDKNRDSVNAYKRANYKPKQKEDWLLQTINSMRAL